MGISTILLVLAFAAFMVEVIRSRATNFVAIGLALWVLALVLTR